jgi:hypothetical protein
MTNVQISLQIKLVGRDFILLISTFRIRNSNRVLGRLRVLKLTVIFFVDIASLDRTLDLGLQSGSRRV